MKPWLINKTVLYFEEIFYVDPVNGLDTNDGLSPFTAFKTIRQYARQTIDNSACILGDEDYPIASNDVDNATNYTRTYIGNGLTTVLKTTVTNCAFGFNGKNKWTNFKGLCIDGSATTSYVLTTSASAAPGYLVFDNVTFLYNSNPIAVSYFAYFLSSGTPVKKYIKYNNCVMKSGNLTHGFHSYAGTNGQLAIYAIEMVNCVVEKPSDITSVSVAVNLTNLVSSVNENIVPSNPWEHIGTGENPDGTQAHIGVYGGRFAWGDWEVKSTISITGEDENIGIRTEPPSYDYTVDDSISGAVLNTTEKVNDVIIRKIYGAERNHEYTLEVPIMEFWQLDNDDSELSITVENGFSEYTRTITFARDVKEISVMILPTVTTSKVVKLTPTVNYAGQATSVQILVSNNALDENPTWEEATAGTQHIFANSTKTDENWAVAMRVTVEGEEGEHITLSPPSFTYST